MLQRSRLLGFVVLVMILTAFGVLEVRLFWVQVTGGRGHAAEARGLQIREKSFNQPRGRICDRTGRVLAASIPSVTVWADRRWLENPRTRIRSEKDETVALLSSLLALDGERLRARIDRYPRPYVPVASRVTEPSIIERLHRYKDQRLLRGVQIEKGFARRYPLGSLLGHVVGFVNREGTGVYGIEALADDLLRGGPGCRVFRSDGIGNEIFSADSQVAPGAPGGDLTLAADATIQLFAEEELARVQREFTPNWAAAVVLEPGTGRVLAAASVPGLDPANPAAGPERHWTNAAFKAEYNPGSSFKPLMMSFALDAGVVSLGETIDCENGRWRVGRRTVTDDHPYGLLPPEGVLVHSSNIGMAKIALRLVPDDARRGSRHFAPVLERLRLLGLGQRPGVLRPDEESPGKFSPLKRWSRTYSLVSVAFGYEMAVTPVQMAAAFLTLANGGVYIPPRLIEAYTGAEGHRIEAPHAPSRRIMSREAAARVRDMLVQVVEEGTGKPARIAGCAVAGKTGTSRKDSDRTKHTASFVAFAPAEEPALLALVVVDEPRGSIYGSRVAAPAVRAILEKGLAYLGRRSDKLVFADDGGAGHADR